jgi:hypothetical protein
MGRASRAKKEQRAATTQLTEAAYFRIKAAIAERVATIQAGREQVATASAKVARELTAAGLDPTGQYELDDATFRARKIS